MGPLSVRSLLLAFAASIAAGALAQRQGYVIHNVMDKNGAGGLAMTCEVPRGWTTQDNVRWDLNLRLNPMSYVISSGRPDGQVWVSYLSGLTFDFVLNGGRLVAGKAPPAKASDFLMEDFRTTHPNMQYQVVDVQTTPIPFPGGPSVPGVVRNAVHSYITVRYPSNTGPMVEKLSEDFYGYIQPSGGGTFRGNWFISGLTVVNAPEGQLPEAMQVGNTVVTSQKMTSSFLARYQKVSSMLLAKTKAEGRAALQQRAHRVVVSGGGYHRRAMDKDTFILYEAIRGLKSRMFSRSIGN